MALHWQSIAEGQRKIQCYIFFVLVGMRKYWEIFAEISYLKLFTQQDRGYELELKSYIRELCLPLYITLPSLFQYQRYAPLCPT